MGLRENINDGTIKHSLDLKQPAASAINTTKKHAEIILEWIANPKSLIAAFKKKPQNETLYKAILEELSIQ